MVGTSKQTIDEISYILLRGGWPETVKEKTIEVAMKTVFDYVEAVINDDMLRVDGKREKLFVCAACFALSLDTFLRL